MALTVAALLTPLQAFVGDLHGLNTLEHQPQKVAAMEGVWETERGAPLLLFAVPNEEERRNDYAIGIPNLASLILTHEMDGEIKGLNEFKGEHPPVKPVFYSFRVMVGMGMLMIAVALLTRFTLYRKGALPDWQLKVLVAMTFSGWIATLAGWYVTEIGRQPYIVSGVLRVEEAVTTLPSGNVLFTLIGYLSIYAVLLYAYIRTLFHTANKSVEVEEYEMNEVNKEVARV